MPTAAQDCSGYPPLSTCCGVLHVASDNTITACAGRLFDNSVLLGKSLETITAQWRNCDGEKLDIDKGVLEAVGNCAVIIFDEVLLDVDEHVYRISVSPQIHPGSAEVAGTCLVFQQLGFDQGNRFTPSFSDALVALRPVDQALWFWWPADDTLYEYGSLKCFSGFTPRGATTSRQAMLERCHPDDLSMVVEAMNRHLRGDETFFSVEHRFKADDGEYRWLLTAGQTIATNSAGRPTIVAGSYSDITDEVNQRTKLARLEPHFELALQGAQHGIWEWDIDSDEFVTNSSWDSLMGPMINTHAITGEFFQQAIHPDDREKTRRSLKALINGEIDNFSIEQRIVQDTGNYKWFHVRCSVLEVDTKGKPTRIGGIHADISEQKKSTELLEEQRRLHKIALETSRVSSWEWFPSGAGKLELYGIWSEELGLTQTKSFLTSEEILTQAHPDDRNFVAETMNACVDGSLEFLDVEFRFRNRNNRFTYVSVRGRVIARDASGDATHVIGTINDIDELKAQQARLDLILTHGHQGLWEWTRENDTLSLSASWYNLFGHEQNSINNLLGRYTDLIHPEDRTKVVEKFRRLLREPDYAYLATYRIRCKSGDYLWITDQGIVSERDPTGQAVAAIGTHTDITAHRLAIDEAKQSRKFLQVILDQLSDSIFWTDQEHRLLGCNVAFAEFLGHTKPDDIIGCTTDQLYPAALARVYENDDNHVLNTGTPIIRQERLAVDSNGKEFWAELTKLPLQLRPHGKDSKGLLCQFRDITLEQARRRQLETLAEIMSGDTGERVLDRLVNGAAELARADIAFIGRFNEESNSVTIIAANSQNDTLDGINYKLANTPCESVISESLCIFGDSVQASFPQDTMLREMDIETYVGRRLLDNNGKTVGLFVLMNTTPIANIDHATSLIDILSSTATYELIREVREAALSESEKRYRNIYDSVPVMICTTDEAHHIQDMNSTWIETTGYIHQEVVGKPLTELFARKDQALLRDSIEQTWAGEEQTNDQYLTLVGADSGEIIVSHHAVHTTTAGNQAVTINVFEDMREKYQSAQQLKLAATAFETHEALVIRDHNKQVLRVNEAFTDITGFTQADIQHTDFDYFEPDDGANIWEVACTDGKWQGNGKCQRQAEAAFSAYQTVTAVKDDAGQVTHFVENFNDITDYVEALAETERLAYFDPLTELPNRRQLEERLAQSLSAAKRSRIYGVVMFIDLDHFKNINDAVGHSVGDQVLQHVSKRLLKILRAEDTIARLGGDEFVVLIPQISAEREVAQKQAVNIAAKIQRDLRRLYYLGDHEFHITPTIGVTLFPDQNCSVDDVLKQADTAMYRAKEEGRNQTKFYHASMQDLAQERLSVEKDLRTAIQREEMHLVFQPQVLPNGQVFGAEALLRWEHPIRGFISPGVFIPIAEETGLIIEIGRWVLDEAFRTLARWEDNFPLNTIEHLSINVSSRQFSSQDFVDDVARRLENQSTNAKKVILEVTESTVIDKIQATVSKMEELKKLGVRFSVDDFGTGYSSLAYLSRLPLDQLKIDRTFVADIDKDPANAVIVETIISMGRHLGLQTIAEGVEEEYQLDFLNKRQCNAFQGYYFSKPLALDEFERLLVENQAQFKQAGSRI